ncbi:MAG: DUF3575 domain-containing protein [Bacteroidia bacterium]|nr:DUF3575 domain-containing protein [Bacteroidia bacterium]
MKTVHAFFLLSCSILLTQSVNATNIYKNQNASIKSTSAGGLKPVKQELVFYPLSFFISGMEMGTEFETRTNNSLKISAGYFMSYSGNSYNYFGNSNNVDFSSMEAFRTEAQYRFYSRSFSAPDNFFVGIYGVYKNITLKGDKTEYDGLSGITKYTPVKYASDAFSIGTVLGYRTRFYDIFSMDFYFGGGITPTNIGDAAESHSFFLPFKKSNNLKLGMTLGIKI